MWTDGQTYSPDSLELLPHETRMIDLRKLRDAQLPDFLGNLIPAGATDGSVTWVRLDNVAVMGRLMVINRGAGMASSYDCCVCPCPMNHTPALDYLSPASSSMAVGGSVGLIYYAGYTDCNYFTYEYNETSEASWSSAQPSIATVNSTGVVTGQGAGTTSVTGQYSAYTYYYNPYESPTCSTGVLQTGYPSSSISVCDFTIAPGTVRSGDCTNGTEQSQAFQATVSPSLTECSLVPSGSSGYASASGNVEIDYNKTSCSFSIYPQCTVYYFSGPKRSDGTAGTITLKMSLQFGRSTVSHTTQPSVTCP